MDQKEIKRRDVMSFDEFIKAYDQVKKIILLKPGEKVHYGVHAIKGESLYVRNDANPYKAFGIPHDEKQADANQKGMSANQVDVFDGAEAKSDKGKDKASDPKHEKETKKAAKDAAAIVGNMSTAIILDEGSKVWAGIPITMDKLKEMFGPETLKDITELEDFAGVSVEAKNGKEYDVRFQKGQYLIDANVHESVSYEKKDLEKTMKKDVDEKQEGCPTDAELTTQYFGMIDSENTSSKEFEDCEKEMVKRGLSTEHPKK